MLLATKCPHCRTTFKVANDQLKLQAGLVRCGICQEVFNGIEHLVSKDDPTHEANQPEPEVTTAEETSSAAAGAPQPHFALQPEPEVVIPAAEISEEVLPQELPETAQEASVETLEFDLNKLEEPSESIESELRATEIPPEDALDEKEEEDEHDALFNSANIDDLTFIRQANAKKRVTWLLSLGTLVLLLALAGQTIYLLKNIIAASYPASKGALTTLCKFAHCQIQLPAQLNELSYEADELHTLARPNRFEFSLLLRNRSELAQSWPCIELTLKNAQKQVVLRRVFMPSEYLPNPTDVATGFPPNQEQAVKLYFEVSDLKASDYVVAIFYP